MGPIDGLGELVPMPPTDVQVLSTRPVSMARRIVDVEQETRYTSYVVIGLCFLVWIMLMSRR